MPSPRTFLASAKGVVALVFTILGAVFTLVGVAISAVAVGTQAAGAPGVVGVAVGGGGMIFVVLGVVLGVVGLGLGASRRAELRELEHLRERGMPCEGTVVDIAQNRKVRVNRRHPWVVRYRYQAGGRDYEGEESMMDVSESVKAGAKVAVVYDPANPDRSALKDV